MDPSGDNSPLWGASQLTYMDLNSHQEPPPHQPSPWSAGDPQQQQHQQVMSQPGYILYPGEMDAHYFGARNNHSPPAVKPDSTTVEHGANFYQHAAGGFHPASAPSPAESIPIPHENGTYPTAEASGSRPNVSPDAGYKSDESGYYAPHGMFQEGYIADSPYQNVNSPPETGVVKYEAPEIKQENLELYRSDQFSVTLVHPSDINGVQSPEESKPIIHENILMRPAINPQNQLATYQQQAPFQMLELQNALIYETHAVLPQSSQIHPQSRQNHDEYLQQKTQTKQQKPRKPRQGSVVMDDQQPSTSRAFPAVQPTRPSSVEKTTDYKSAVPSSVCRSARPSVVEKSDFQCELCGSYFKRQCGLTQHRKWIHSGRNYPCQQCGKRYATPEATAKHFEKHNKENKKFKCQLCPKQFCHPNDLRRHMIVHKGKSQFMCDQCPKYFIRKDHLIGHLQSHERRAKKAQNKENHSLDRNN